MVFLNFSIPWPKAAEIAQLLTDIPLSTVKYYWFADGVFAGVPARIARTGYTGEDGFEIYIAPVVAVRVWNATLDAGRPFAGR